MITRIVTNVGAPLVDGKGAPAAQARVRFYLVDEAGKTTDAWDVISGERVLPGPVEVLTDENGEFSIPLWPTSRGDRILYWLCVLEGLSELDFLAPLVEGEGDLQWAAFKADGSAPTPQQYKLWVQTTSGVATKASLDAAAGAYEDGECLVVTNDPTPANNGTWRKEGGGWVQGSFDRVAALEKKARFTNYTNTLYASDFASGFYTGTAPTPASCSLAITSNATWSAVGIRKALRMAILGEWTGAVIKYFWDVNQIADGMATAAFDPGTPADFHPGETAYFRFSYRSNKAATFGLFSIKANGGYDGSLGSINLPSTNGAVAEIGGAFVVNSASVDQAFIYPRFYGSSSQNFSAGDYLEVSGLALQNTVIPAGVVCLHPTKDEPLAIVAGAGISVTDNMTARTKTIAATYDPARTTSLENRTTAVEGRATTLEAKRRHTRYDNLLSNTAYQDGVPGRQPNPAYTVGSIATAAGPWLALGFKKIFRFDVAQLWNIADYKYFWYASKNADGTATFSINPGDATDLHQGDTLFYRFLYRNSAAMSAQIQVLSAADGWLNVYHSIPLPNTNGALSEITGSFVLNNANASQKYATLVVYGTAAQNFVAGDYFEIADLVFSKTAIAAGFAYQHPTKDEPLTIVAGAGITATNDLAARTKTLVATAASFVPNPNTRGKRFLIFGDSISATATVDEITGAYVEGSATANWPSYAKPMLGMAAMVNYAKSGAAYRDRTGLDNEWQKMSYQVSKAIEFNVQADVVVVKMGTNDGVANLGDFATAMGKANLAALDRTLLYEAIRWAFLSIATQWPLATYFVVLPIQRASTTTTALAPLYTAITEMAQIYNFKIINATFESGIIREFETVGVAGRDLYDGLHPGTTGKIKLANLIAAKINSAFNY